MVTNLNITHAYRSTGRTGKTLPHQKNILINKFFTNPAMTSRQIDAKEKRTDYMHSFGVWEARHSAQCIDSASMRLIKHTSLLRLYALSATARPLSLEFSICRRRSVDHGEQRPVPAS